MTYLVTVTKSEAAIMLGVRRRVVDRLVLEGELPTVKFGASRNRRIRVRDIERFVERSTAHTSGIGQES